MDNMTLEQRAAYLKGLMTGMKYEATSDEGKLISALIDLVMDLTEKVSVMDEELDDLFSEVDLLGEGLDDVESYLWEDDDDDDDMDDAELFDDELYEIKCPTCGEVVCLDEGMLAAEDLACPNCATKFEVDFSGGCDCCGHGHDDENTGEE